MMEVTICWRTLGCSIMIAHVKAFTLARKIATLFSETDNEGERKEEFQRDWSLG